MIRNYNILRSSLGSPYFGKLPFCVQYRVRPNFFSGLGAWAFGAWWEGRMLGPEPYSLIRPGSLLLSPRSLLKTFKTLTPTWVPKVRGIMAFIAILMGGYYFTYL